MQRIPREELQQKVNDLKVSVDVSCKPLINTKKYNDDYIAAQIETMLLTPKMKIEIEQFLETMFASVPVDMPTNLAKERCYELIYGVLGWGKDGLAPFDNEFWANFGSAPYFIDYEYDTNTKLKEYARKHGAKGMREIFGKKFEQNHDLYQVENFMHYFSQRFEEKKKRVQKATLKFESPFSSLDDLEDNVVAKKIEAEARIFFLDKSKPLDERIRVFEKYGKKDSSIHQPENPLIRHMFDMFHEQGYRDRHEMITTLEVLEWWMEKLSEGRTIIDYSKNKYHPTLKKKKRGYKPSKEAIQRLENFYRELIILEEVAEYELDW